MLETFDMYNTTALESVHREPNNDLHEDCKENIGQWKQDGPINIEGRRRAPKLYKYPTRV